MEYISTRGLAPTLSFEEVLIAGLASDGGLYVPKEYPEFSPREWTKLAKLPYEELAFAIMRPFVGDSFDDATLSRLIHESYSTFRHQAIAPLVQTGTHEWVLELFHGPTLAFKDFALQLLGRMLDHVLTKQKRRVIIIGATSGDTGSAAIEGCKHTSQADIVILHPHERVSPVQRRQMTTVLAPNVHNIALKGDFDDCQNIVKSLFADSSFLQGKTQFVAVNSINWARIMAQIVYYAYAALQLGAPARSLAFSVPTGNFGDIFAGYVAKRMGLPIHQLIVATNQNDILHRFFEHNAYNRKPLLPSLSPSMDIQVSSNFERLLFDLHGRDGTKLRSLMDTFREKGELSVNDSVLGQAKQLFSSYRMDDAQTARAIKELYTETGMLIDPHTITGFGAARHLRALHPSLKDDAMVILATAHPAKFTEAAIRADVPVAPLPSHMKDVMTKEEHFHVLPNGIEAVRGFVSDQLLKKY